MSRSVVCSNCGHSLSMSDDIYNRRVAGKVVTIKCRQCGTPIRVDGRQDTLEVGTSPEAPVPDDQLQVSQPLAPVSDPLDPFTMPDLQGAPPVPARAPMPSLDDVVSSAPRFPPDRELAASVPIESDPQQRSAPPQAPQPPEPPARADLGPEEPEPAASSPLAAQQVAAEPAPAVAQRPAPPAPSAAMESFGSPVAPPPLPGAGSPPAPPAPAAPAGPFTPAASPAFPPVAAAAAVSAPAAPVQIPAAAPVPDVPALDAAVLRDPHAAFRRRPPKALWAVAAGVCVVMGGVIYASRGSDDKVVKKQATQEAKPTIGVTLAPYRSDAQETLPVQPAAPSKRPTQNEDAEGAPIETGSSTDFAQRFKAASGRE